MYVGDERLLASDFGKVRLSEIIGAATSEEKDPTVKARPPSFTARSGRPMGNESAAWRRWNSSVVIYPTGLITASATKCIN